MKIYTKNEVMDAMDREFYARGFDYRINPWTMGGSQGEVAKIDLMANDGSHLIRIVLDRFHEHVDFWVNGLALRVLRFEAEYLEHRGDLLWNGDGEVVSERKFYEVPNSEGRYTDLEGAKWQRAIRRERHRASSVNENEVAFDAEKVAEIASRHRGFKRVKPEDVKMVVRSRNGWSGRIDGYSIRFNKPIGHQGDVLHIEF